MKLECFGSGDLAANHQLETNKTICAPHWGWRKSFPGFDQGAASQFLSFLPVRLASILGMESAIPGDCHIHHLLA